MNYCMNLVQKVATLLECSKDLRQLKTNVSDVLNWVCQNREWSASTYNTEMLQESQVYLDTNDLNLQETETLTYI